MDASPVIETERLILRKPTLEDGEALLAIHTDPVAMEFIGGVHPEIRTDPEWPIRRWLARWEQNSFGPFIVERTADGCVVGRTGFLLWDSRDWHVSSVAEAGEHAQPELGWAFVREHWGKGYATEAARAAREWGHAQGIEGLISLIAPANVRSARLAERLGCTARETVELFDTGPAVVWEHPR